MKYQYSVENAYEEYVSESRAEKAEGILSMSEGALDFGCGVGTPWKRQKAPCFLTAWDINEDSLNKAIDTQRYGAVLVTSLPQHFDTVLLMGVLEHIEEPEILIEELLLDTSPDYLYITVPNGDSIHRRFGVESNMLNRSNDLTTSDVDFGHFHCFTIETLEEMISDIDELIILSSGSTHCKISSSANMQDWMDVPQWRALDKATEGIVHGEGKYNGAELYMIIKTEIQ